MCPLSVVMWKLVNWLSFFGRYSYWRGKKLPFGEVGLIKRNLNCRSGEIWANEYVNLVCPCRNALPDLHPDPPRSSQCEAPNNGTGWGGLDLSQTRRGHHQRFTQRSGSSCVPEVTLRLHGVRGRASGDVCGDGGGHKPSRWTGCSETSHDTTEPLSCSESVYFIKSDGNFLTLTTTGKIWKDRRG